MQRTADTRLAPVVRWTFVLVALVLLAGLSLFFAPGLIGPRWPWALPSFNARFLGAVYLAEMVAVAFTIATNSWAVARLTLAQSFTFTAAVLLASLVEINAFDFGRPITWAWFIIYSIPMLLTGYYTWAYRHRSPADGRPVGGLWRGYLLAQGVALGLYGLGALIAPLAFTSFWPWEADALHGRVYSGLFITGAVGSLLLARVASRLELLTLGVTQAVLGIAAITGLAIVDASLQRVDWLDDRRDHRPGDRRRQPPARRLARRRHPGLDRRLRCAGGQRDRPVALCPPPLGAALRGSAPGRAASTISPHFNKALRIGCCRLLRQV